MSKEKRRRQGKRAVASGKERGNKSKKAKPSTKRPRVRKKPSVAGRRTKGRSGRPGRPPVARPAVGLELDAPVPARPPELAWVAGLRLHWAGTTSARRQRAVALLRSAAARKNIERSLSDIQKAMSALYVHHLHADQIILHLFPALASQPPLEAVRQLAAEIRKLLESFGPVSGRWKRRVRR